MIVSYMENEGARGWFQGYVRVQVQRTLTGMFIGVPSAAKLYAGLGVALTRAMRRTNRGKCLKCGCDVHNPGGIRHPDPNCNGVLVPYP